MPDMAVWLDAFMEEAQSFPSGKHDDQIDALSMGLEAIAKMGGAASELMNGPINMASSLSAQFQQAEQKQWWAADLKHQPQFKGWGEL